MHIVVQEVLKSMWKKSCDDVVLSKSHTVHLWLADLPRLKNKISCYEQLLSVEEWRRATKFIQKSDQEKFILSKSVTRIILSRYLNCAPEKVNFKLGEHEKPYILGGLLQFNISHSGDYFLLGVTLTNPIGVDIEFEKNNLDFLSLAKRFFSTSEYDAISTVLADEQKSAFYRCWTRKEAFVKATGLGLSFGLSDFEVAVSESVQSQLLHVSCAQFSADDFVLRSVFVARKNYHAAFAVHGVVDEVFCFEF